MHVVKAHSHLENYKKSKDEKSQQRQATSAVNEPHATRHARAVVNRRRRGIAAARVAAHDERASIALEREPSRCMARPNTRGSTVSTGRGCCSIGGRRRHTVDWWITRSRRRAQRAEANLEHTCKTVKAATPIWSKMVNAASQRDRSKTVNAPGPPETLPPPYGPTPGLAAWRSPELPSGWCGFGLGAPSAARELARA